MLLYKATQLRSILYNIHKTYMHVLNNFLNRLLSSMKGIYVVICHIKCFANRWIELSQIKKQLDRNLKKLKSFVFQENYSENSILSSIIPRDLEAHWHLQLSYPVQLCQTAMCNWALQISNKETSIQQDRLTILAKFNFTWNY